MEKTQESNSNKGNLGLDIGIAAYKVLTTDPPKVKQLKEAIARIDEVLISGHSDRLLYENQSVCSEFPEIVFARQSGITRTTEEFMRSQPQSIQYESLKAIGLVLYDAVKAGKAIQAFEEASKVAIQKAREDILGILNKD